MIINACGDGCFRIQTVGLAIMSEPFTGELSARFKPDILLKSRYQPGEFTANPGYFVVEGPGEYEIKGIEIFGYPKQAYLVKSEEMKLGFIPPHFTDQDLAGVENMEGLDILFIPATEAAEKIIKQLAPKIIIPATKDFEKLAKAFSQRVTPQEKITIKRKELPVEGLQIVALSS